MKTSVPEPAPIPEPTPAPPPPTRSAEQVQQSASEQRQRYYGAQGGRSSTLLTGGSGAETPSSAVRLLGNVGR